MKRDLELIRKILLALEEKESLSPRELTIEGYASKEISFHCVLLKEAEFIDAIIEPEFNSNTIVLPIRLTWSGFEFLQLSRNETVWKKSINFLKEKSLSLSVSLLIELLKSGIKGKSEFIDAIKHIGE